MNRKILILTKTLIVLSILSTFFVSSVGANRGQTKKDYVEYRFDAILTDAVVNIEVTPPTIVIEGYRPPSGVQNCVVTINGDTYSYPEDFDYNESFRIIGNIITGEGVLEVKTVFTFNLPGNPTITEWLSGQVTGIGTGNMVLDGSFYLTGNKMFNKVDGGGTTFSTQVDWVDYALHIGLINGWPFGE
jgi:hypothetical protein